MQLERLAAALASVVLLVCISSPVGAQEDKIAAASAKLDAAIKSKTVADAQAAIDELIGLYIDANGAKDTKGEAAVVQALSKALRAPSDDPQVIEKAALGLGGMGEEAAKVLSAAVKDKRLGKEEAFKPPFLQVIRSLGTTKSDREAKTLVDLLKDKDNDVIAAAAEALGNFDSTTKLTTRKMVAEELIKTLDSAFNAAEGDPRNTTLQKKYEAIGPPVMSALQKVTGTSVGTAPEWRKWFNDNKKKKWD